MPPMAINISLNEEATFKCVAVAHHINWKANNTPVNAISNKGFTGSAVPTPVNVAENLYSSELRVTGSHFSNASEIVCIASLLVMKKFTIATSEPMLLLVQGIYYTTMYMLVNMLVTIKYSNLCVVNHSCIGLTILSVPPYFSINFQTINI